MVQCVLNSNRRQSTPFSEQGPEKQSHSLLPFHSQLHNASVPTQNNVYIEKYVCLIAGSYG